MKNGMQSSNEIPSRLPSPEAGRPQEALRRESSCFGILEGGYNHQVLGGNVLAFIEEMEEG